MSAVNMTMTLTAENSGSKSVPAFRQFLLHGLDGVRGEWTLVSIAWT